MEPETRQAELQQLQQCSGLTQIASDVNKDLGPKAKDFVPEATDPHQA